RSLRVFLRCFSKPSVRDCWRIRISGLWICCYYRSIDELIRVALSNTKKEADELVRQRSNNLNWYDEFYAKKAFMPSEQFFKNEVPIIFTNDLIDRLKSRKTQFLERNDIEYGYIEILVNTVESDEIEAEHEGIQHVFGFKSTDNGYKFCEISTVP
ncbi:hypothetical protein QSV34_11765, partial [Porticoccus sp. W117]|uniref:hypothetical protein n=1 Tax=Porticoccus sp. W117 TaxID=3054777 RepID=UPI0025974BA7